MKSQQEIIKRYKELYPQDKLREISARTGINLTRVYRIVNGKEMSVSEFEIFQNLINLKMKNRPEYSVLEEAIQKSIHLFSTQEINKLINWIERKNFIHMYQQINS